MLILTAFALSPHVFAERTITVDVEGTFSSAATTIYDGSVSYSHTCLCSASCCYSYTVTVPNAAPPNAELLQEGDQVDGATITIISSNGIVAGQFLHYDNQPVPRGNILDRTHVFTIIPF